MTRALSELLGAREPSFHQGLRRLEAASGHTSADIRLSTEIERATRLKLKELGLDPQDTTGEELYAALQARVKDDDVRLSRQLTEKYGAADAVHINVGKALNDLPVYKSCFALKTAVGRKLLAKLPPKQAMKALGYRSFESMLRREQLLNIYAAAWLLESASWRKSMADSYKKLAASDFEIRQFVALTPHSKHWQTLAETIVTQKKHNVVALKEFGAVVILPFPTAVPPAATMTALLMALHDMNEVRAGSTFLKLCQVRPDFGKYVQTVVAGEPALPADVLDGSVDWNTIQRYYARFGDRYREDIFEPHIQKEDLSWHSVEKALVHIAPSLSFWHHTSALGLHTGQQPVSMNVLDAALNFCNQLPYKYRIVHHFRRSLWGELVIRYLKHESVEQAVISSLESKLNPEPANDEEYELAE